MKKWGTQLLIHGFALSHAVTVALCARAGLPDTLFLTVLTMAMAIVICYREQLTVQVTIVSLVLVNVLGFVRGNLGAQVVFEDYPPVWQHVFSTFIVTELLGWSLFLFAHRFKPVGATHYERRQSWIHGKWWLVAIVAAIFGLRIYIGINYKGNLFQDSAALGIMTITPSEGAIIAADVATKAASVEVVFVDRFNGTLIVNGDVASVEAALKDVLDVLHNLIGFTPTVITRT